MQNSNGNHSLKLDEARKLTPAVDPVEAMRRNLALAVFGGVSEQDVMGIVGKIKEQALAGDHKAQQLLLKLVLGDGKVAPAQASTDGAGLRMMAEAIKDLVDEIRIDKHAKKPKRITSVDPEDE